MLKITKSVFSPETELIICTNNPYEYAVKTGISLYIPFAIYGYMLIYVPVAIWRYKEK